MELELQELVMATKVVLNYQTGKAFKRSAYKKSKCEEKRVSPSMKSRVPKHKMDAEEEGRNSKSVVGCTKVAPLIRVPRTTVTLRTGKEKTHPKKNPGFH